MSLEIRAVAPGAPDFDAFVELPWRIYPGQAAWVPPLRATLAEELSLEHPFFTHGEAQAFLCLRDGAPVARVVASVDHALAEATVGHFGYFEALEDAEAVAALLGAAEAWVRERGRTSIHGPIDLTIFNRYRIQTEGFERPPFFGEPRSPRYYAPMLAAQGYRTHLTWRSWDLPRWIFFLMIPIYWWKARAFPDVLTRYHILPFDQERFDQDVAAMYPILLETFAQNYGFTRLPLEEHMRLYAGAQAIHCKEISFKGTDLDGRLIGFAYTYHDVAPAFVAADGDAAKLDLSRPTDTLVLYSFGIQREHRKSGLTAVGFRQVFPRMVRLGFKRAVGALAKEGPTVYDKMGHPTRRYAVLAKELGS